MSSLSDRTITVPSIVSHYTDEELNEGYHNKKDYVEAVDNYGVIFKILNFSECEKQETLQKYVREWIRNNYYDGVLSFSIKAIDLHMLGYNTDKILCGDQIPVQFLDYRNRTTTKTLSCISAKYDLIKPENSQFKIGIPDVSTESQYRESVTKRSSKPKPPKTTMTTNDVQDIVVDLLSDFGINIDVDLDQ